MLQSRVHTAPPKPATDVLAKLAKRFANGDTEPESECRPIMRRSLESYLRNGRVAEILDKSGVPHETVQVLYGTADGSDPDEPDTHVERIGLIATNGAS